MNIFTSIKNGLKKFWLIITSRKAQAAVEQAVSLVNVALPIVQELSAINTKTAKISDVVEAYRKYGIPLLTTYTQNPTSIGNALLNLASSLLEQKVAKDGRSVATNILNTAVQLAFTALKNA